MFPAIKLLPGALAELFAHAMTTGVVTVADRYGLLAALLEETLDMEEREAVDRLLRSIYRGQVKPVDDLSVIL